ncbi:hypothetical protein EXIGLDRAFT_217642 [Exidia glandulosa HHB12029]|uniref:Uncharacterized protein n=1 Tax=Exidia glandulosa HHB12029 TaxID=1314781 RepID=A0A165ZY81_EXIGL|nr:hypothetical protein EXIGLDRAFT_217642 [Exidia glandulosa HHB12029]
MDAGLYTTLRVLVCRLGEHLDHYLPLSSYRRWEIFERYYWQRALHVRTSWDEQLRLEPSAVTVYYKNTGYQHPVPAFLARLRSAAGDRTVNCQSLLRRQRCFGVETDRPKLPQRRANMQIRELWSYNTELTDLRPHRVRG